MTKLSCVFLLLIWGIFLCRVSAQSSEDLSDKVYGHDPLLINGRAYNFFPPAGTGGTPFLFGSFDEKGSVSLRGVTYSAQKLNYDIYNQQLILEYKNPVGSVGLIQISGAWLQHFTIYNRYFEMATTTDSAGRIYQMIGNGAAKVLYYHYKELFIDTRTLSRSHYFPDAITEKYVLLDNRIIRYTNNRSFANAFGRARKDVIKKHLRRNKIKVRKANDGVMTEVINYCNTLKGL